MKPGLSTQVAREPPVSPILPLPRPPGSQEPQTAGDIYRRHADDVARWAARLGALRVDVEDVVQDVFSVVDRKIGSFRGDAKLTTWLFRITDKTVRNHRRRALTRRFLLPWSEPAARRAPSHSPGPFELLAARQEAQLAFEILNRLSERERKVMVLFEMEELSAAEIAELLDTKVSTVRVWLFRARARFLVEQRLAEQRRNHEQENEP
jgi:RNA polymerase sigma factor (sigma-70 family)